MKALDRAHRKLTGSREAFPHLFVLKGGYKSFYLNFPVSKPVARVYVTSEVQL